MIHPRWDGGSRREDFGGTLAPGACMRRLADATFVTLMCSPRSSDIITPDGPVRRNSGAYQLSVHVTYQLHSSTMN